MSITKPDEDSCAAPADQATRPSHHHLLWPQLFPYRRRPAEMRPYPGRRELRLIDTPACSDGLDPGGRTAQQIVWRENQLSRR